MIFNCKHIVTLRDGSVAHVDNFERGLGNIVEFDYNENHYCVRMPRGDEKFKTFIGTLNKEDYCYDYKLCTDFEVMKITCVEEYIERCVEE